MYGSPITAAAIDAPHNASRLTIADYGAGDFGFNLYFTGLNLYLLYYYMDVLGIDPAVAGLIFMIPVIRDGISDPIMGWLATRIRTPSCRVQFPSSPGCAPSRLILMEAGCTRP